MTIENYVNSFCSSICDDFCFPKKFSIDFYDDIENNLYFMTIKYKSDTNVICLNFLEKLINFLSIKIGFHLYDVCLTEKNNFYCKFYFEKNCLFSYEN